MLAGMSLDKMMAGKKGVKAGADSVGKRAKEERVGLSDGTI